MNWLDAFTNAVLIVVAASVLMVSGLGAMFALEVRLQRIYGIAFIVTFTTVLAWVLRFT